MGKKIFITHGHMYNVKSTLYELANEAISQKADIVLFGHTHNRYSEYRDEIHFLNPGSLHGYGASYGFVDITEDGGIITNIVSVK
jgi:putative phosphoesterase